MTSSISRKGGEVEGVGDKVDGFRNLTVSKKQILQRDRR
jgi:hypothetical protein